VNYIVALYLIVIGLIGILHRQSASDKSGADGVAGILALRDPGNTSHMTPS